MLASAALIAAPLVAQTTGTTTTSTTTDHSAHGTQTTEATPPDDATATRAGKTGVAEPDAQDSTRNNRASQSTSAKDAQGATTQGTTTPTMTQNDSATTSGTSVRTGTTAASPQEMQQPAQATTRPTASMGPVPGMGMGGPLNVESNWSRFDEGGKGYLTPLEFGEWVMETNGQNVSRQIDSTRRSRNAGNPSVEVLNATAGALAQVDTNSDWRVSRDELASIAE